MRTLQSVVDAADAREARVRAVEIAQASQGSDLRAILLSIQRMESNIAKLSSK